MRTHISRSDEPIVEIRGVAEQKDGPKPYGFWYSVDGDWERWCESESPSWITGQPYEVTLGQENMLLIRTVSALDYFHSHYSKSGEKHFYSYKIDWASVAAIYDGIEIAPYLWERRLDGRASDWYYGWDCASGCIWRPKGVSVSCLERSTSREGQ